MEKRLALLGATALVTDREVTSRLQAYVNIEAIGSAGAPLLFETGPGNSWLVKQWARHAPNPRGASFGIEIYRRLPNDTDFSVLKRLGIPGLNFGATEDSYAYHTTRDTPERLASRTIRDTGEQVVAVMTALDATDVTQRSDSSSTFFDVGRAFRHVLWPAGRAPARDSSARARNRRLGARDRQRQSGCAASRSGCSPSSGRSSARSPSWHR